MLTRASPPDYDDGDVDMVDFRKELWEYVTEEGGWDGTPKKGKSGAERSRSKPQPSALPLTYSNAVG